MALQEVDVNAESAPGFVAAWQARGYHCLFGARDPVHNLRRTALLAKGALQPVSLSVPAGPARFTAGLVDVFCNESRRSVLVISFYGQPGDDCLTGQILEQIMQSVRKFGGPFILLGDFNCTIDDGPVATVLATGQARCLDEDLRGPLPNTNPNDSRRIDFALVHRSFFAKGCELDLRIHPCAYHCPRFLQLTTSDPETVAAALMAEWDESHFETLLRNASVDEAWTYLSDTAENALGALHFPGGVRRSALWDPVRYQAPNHRCGPEGHQSETVRALCRLKSRLRHFRDQPTPELRAKIGRVLMAS